MSSNQKPEQSLWENVHQASKIYILPNSFTAGNLFFGFLSIILCVQGRFNADSTDRTIDHIAALITPNYTAGASAPSTGYYVLAIICILASFLCDALDGRVARASGKTSLFGKEFDSIADSVSFGIAPCLLMFFLILQPSAMLSDTWIRLLRNTGWLIGFIFMLCAADVVLGEIREEAELKREACNAVVLEADGRDLHNAVFAAGIDHFTK